MTPLFEGRRASESRPAGSPDPRLWHPPLLASELWRTSVTALQILGHRSQQTTPTIK